MSKHKVWSLQYVVGNPKIFTKVTTAAGCPMSRSEALAGAQTIDSNGGGWRVWVVHERTGERIYESAAEKTHQTEKVT